MTDSPRSIEAREEPAGDRGKKGGDGLLSAVRAHIDAFLGTPATEYMPCDAFEPRVAVLEYPPRDSLSAWTYVTLGMSSCPQHLPDEAPPWLSTRIELFCYTREKMFWPVEVLNLVGRLPVERKSWLYWWHTVDCGGPLDERDDCNLTALLFLPPYFERAGFDDFQYESRRLRFLMAVPITESERMYAIARGGQALEERLMEENADFVFGGSRRSTV